MQTTLRLMALFWGLIALFMVIGWVLGSFLFDDWLLGMLIFIILAGVINFISYFFSHKIVLWSYKAKIIAKEEQPRLYNIVNKVCLKANMPMPRIAIVSTQTPNAFATGRNEKTAVVAATDGLLSLLTDDELEGVLAHEMAHIKDRDMLVMTVAATVAGAIAFAARMAFWSSLGGRRGGGNGNPILLLVVMITAPIAALLIRLAISRSREYKADKEGALMIQRPLALARALEKLEEGNKRRPMTRGSPTTSSLFIVNPFRGGGFVTLFMTHPPIATRVKRLEDLADKTGFIG
jgi:heat shock protein HtpX